MARLRALKSNFTSGEVDPLLGARVDLKAYRNGADKARNVLVQPQGGVKRRPGSEYVDHAHHVLTSIDLSAGGVTVTAPNGGTAANAIDGDDSTVVLTTASIGTTDPYVLLHVDLGAATDVFFVDVRLLKLTASASTDEFRVQYSTDDVSWSDINGTFSDITDTARTRRVKKSGAEAAVNARYWRLAKVGGTDLGTNKASIGELVMWDESGTESETRLISFEFSTTQNYVMVASDRNLAVYKSDDNTHVADISIPHLSAELGDLNWTQNLDTLLLVHEDHPPLKVIRQGDHDEWHPVDWPLSNIPTYDFGSGAVAVWSTTQGWPLSATFFQGRLWFAGSRTRPQTLWASKSGDPEDFDTSTTDDDFGIDVTADTDDVSAFYNIYAGRHLQLFSSSAEYYVPVSDTAAVTPTNIVLRRTTSRGSEKGLRVFEVDGATMFMQRGGKALREFLFVDTEAAYQAGNLSLLASHLVTSPVDISLRRSTATEEADYVWVVNSDGSMAAFCTLRTQDINGWTLLETDGNYKNVTTVQDDTYMIVERTVGGETHRYLEQFNSSLYTDSAVYDFALGVDTSSASGLDHLEAETVAARLDSVVQNTLTVSSGSVTFARDAESTYEVGLPFPDVTASFDTTDVDYATGYETFVRTLRAEEALPEGSQIGQKKRIVHVTSRVYETTEIYVNGNFAPLRSFGSNLLDEAIAPFTGDVEVGSILGWTLDGYVKFGQKSASPLTLLGAAYKLAV